MGFRQGALLATTCFLFGVLLACFTVDYRVLFEPLTEEPYRMDFNITKRFTMHPLESSLIGIGVASIIAKIHRWDESAMLFDGGSLGVDTREDQIEAMRVLSAGNTLMMVLLGGVLTLQGGQEWARRLEVREVARVAAEEAKEELAEKKGQ
ncbi:hypothetical protein BGW80DRAFT_1436395 [Lactifluus volemus]|nr:hypothetical protein BGW80DRAFT_1436395 [Lactifluus volemus]